MKTIEAIVDRRRSNPKIVSLIGKRIANTYGSSHDFARPYNILYTTNIFKIWVFTTWPAG